MSRNNLYKPEADKNRRAADPAHERKLSAAQSAAGWERALQVECEIHHASGGVPCWTWPGSRGHHKGLCEARARAAGLVRPAPRPRSGKAPSGPSRGSAAGAAAGGRAAAGASIPSKGHRRDDLERRLRLALNHTEE